MNGENKGENGADSHEASHFRVFLCLVFAGSVGGHNDRSNSPAKIIKIIENLIFVSIVNIYKYNSLKTYC